MVRYALRWTCRPSGWKRTAFTVPDATTAVIIVGDASAPAGMTSEWEPIRLVPPSAPMVWVVEAYGSGRHVRRPVGASRPPIRSLRGVDAREATPSGERSPQPRLSAPAAPSRRAGQRRLAVMR